MSKRNTPTLEDLISKATLSEKLLIEAVLTAQGESPDTLDAKKKLLEWESKRLDYALVWFGDLMRRTMMEHPGGTQGLKQGLDRAMEGYIKRNPKPRP